MCVSIWLCEYVIGILNRSNSACINFSNKISHKIIFTYRRRRMRQEYTHICIWHILLLCWKDFILTLLTFNSSPLSGLFSFSQYGNFTWLFYTFINNCFVFPSALIIASLGSWSASQSGWEREIRFGKQTTYRNRIDAK